jgi:NAD(P)-dependent dehydrogenase (short-subunit alcohol dehydrogenase family)
VHIFAGDMVDSASLENAALEVSKITQGVDYLIVNGAYFSLKSARFHPSEFTGRAAYLREEMVDSLDVNVVGVIYPINAFLPLVRKGIVKKVTVLTSGLTDANMAVQQNIPGLIVYASMKAARNMVVAKYAVELRGEGIVVFAFSPGFVDTEVVPGKLFACEDMKSICWSDRLIASEEELKGFIMLIQKYQAIYPEFKSLSSPAESVTAQKKIIDGVTLEQIGLVLSHTGNKDWL